MNINLNEAQKLPAFAIASQVNEAMHKSGNVVITAPPGAGKSTLLPLTMLQSLPQGKIYVLEPRRLAAKQIAQRMAWLIGEPVGETVGYRVRFEKCVSKSTRIEVVTEGILTRMLMEDSMLEEAAAVIFDEFHERNIHSDISLALLRELQQIIRPDLKLIIMSATIDTAYLCEALHAPLIESQGRMFPVEVRYVDDLPKDNYTSALTETARFIIRAHQEHEGDILVFLPGEAEIRRVEQLLADAFPPQTHVRPLYGMLSPVAQREAISVCPPGQRKVVLATSIAETSLTIEGVHVVIDSGLHRKMVYDARRGLSHLETAPISLDMAEQRRGRAGRLSAGVCYRLWSKSSEARMKVHRVAEIEEADLSPMALSVAAWGESDVEQLPWLTPPPKANLFQAQSLLSLLGALDEQGAITPHGRRLAQLPCHPRIAQMILKAQNPTEQELAASISALLESPSSSLPHAGRPTADIDVLLDELHTLRRQGKAQGAWSHIVKAADYYQDMSRRMAHSMPTNINKVQGQASSVQAQTNSQVCLPRSSGYFIALAYPERIACLQKEGLGSFRLSSGGHAQVDVSDDLSTHEWLAIAHMNGTQEGRVFLAASLSKSYLPEFAFTTDRIAWDNKQGCIIAEQQQRIGNLLLSARPLHDLDRQHITHVLCDAASKWGTSMLDFNDDVAALQLRVATADKWHPELALPNLATTTILARAHEWLPFYLGKSTTTAELKKIRLTDALWGILTYEQQQVLEQIVPTHILLPNGRKARVEYRQGAELPIVRVRIQDCFGMQDTPRVDHSTRPLLMELLSPGFKPVQLTQDLRSFWSDTYFEVRKELKRRYPKHAWPDNPANTSRASVKD